MAQICETGVTRECKSAINTCGTVCELDECVWCGPYLGHNNFAILVIFWVRLIWSQKVSSPSLSVNWGFGCQACQALITYVQSDALERCETTTCSSILIFTQWHLLVLESSVEDKHQQQLILEVSWKIYRAVWTCPPFNSFNHRCGGEIFLYANPWNFLIWFCIIVENNLWDKNKFICWATSSSQMNTTFEIFKA